MPNISTMSSGSPFDVQQREIDRRRKMAEALQAQSMQPIEQQTAGGMVVPISWTQGLAKMLQAYGGMKGMERAESESKALSERRNKALADALSTMPKARQESVELPAGTGMTGGLDSQDFVMPSTEQRTVRPTMQENAAWLGQLAQVGPDATQIGGTLLGLQQKSDEAQESRAQRLQELQLRLADARTTAQERVQLQRDIAALQDQTKRDVANLTTQTQRDIAQANRESRADLAAITAGMRQPPAPVVTEVMRDGKLVKIDARTGAVIGDAPPAGQGKPMSATAQKELIETDEQIQGGQGALELFRQAKAINDKAMGFTGAATVASAGSLLPQFMRPGAVDATQSLDNILQSAALPQLKAIFGGMPTEGERKILLDVQGSSSKPPAVRKEIFERAERAIQARMKFAQDKAKALREGRYFSGDGGVNPGAPATTPPAGLPSTADIDAELRRRQGGR